MPNARVQRGRERQGRHDKRFAARPPLQRLVRPRADLTLNEIEVCWTVASDEQVYILASVCLPAVCDLWRDNDIIADRQRVPILPQNVRDFPTQDDCILGM